MAAPVIPQKAPAASASALQLLEDAVHLLRAAPFATLAWHWAGSLPMAAGAVFFWNDMTNPHLSGPRLAAEALLVALLLAWLNLCRALYAGRLRDQLAGVPPQTASGRAWWRMAAAQGWLGATKLIVVPLAGISGILLAPAVAFYRNAAALSARELSLGPLSAKARRYAGHQGAQSWRALGLLACLYVLLLLNLVMILAILPQFARTLTGYETAYSRMGARLLEDALFWSLSFALTWLLFDPFVQAVYSVRCFEAESAETGEDVKAVVRRLRGGGVAAALLLGCTLALAPAIRAENVPPPDLRRAVQQAAQAPEYDWRILPETTQKQQPSWFVAATDRIVETTRVFLRTLSDGLGRLMRWIFGRPAAAPTQGGAPPAGTLPAGIWVLIALVLAAGGYAFVRARYPARKAVAAGGGIPVATREDAEEMDPLRFPEQTWIDLAERCLAEQNWRLAMRAFYLASLGWLGRHEFVRIHSGKTNREYEVELRSRAAPTPRERFARNVAAFERTWYGMHPAGAEDVARFRAEMQAMQTELEAA